MNEEDPERDRRLTPIPPVGGGEGGFDVFDRLSSTEFHFDSIYDKLSHHTSVYDKWSYHRDYSCCSHERRDKAMIALLPSTRPLLPYTRSLMQS